MPRAIDFHVHLPTTEFMQVTLGPYAQAAERFFRTEVKLKDIEQIAADYAELDMIGVLLAWDAETATGLPPLSNDYIAEIVRRYPQQFIGFASVDPHKGKVAVKEIERAIKELGLAGAKFHPGVQAFYPNDPQFYPLMDRNWAFQPFSIRAPTGWELGRRVGWASSSTIHVQSISIRWQLTSLG